MNERKTYSTDLSDPEWEKIVSLLAQKKTPPERAREYINAIVYLVHSGCSWRMLPHDFLPWSSVSTYFRKLMRGGTWERINDCLREQVRQQVGRETEPSVVIVNSQSVKMTEKGAMWL